MSVRRVLLIHNFYRFPGGEDAAVRAQVRLLQEAGIHAELFSVNSAELEGDLGRYAQLPYSISESRRLKKFLKGRSFDVAHLHNLTPFLSASVLDAVPAGMPRVQTLHNFRAFCVNGLFLRDGRPCEDCPKGSGLEGVFHRCHEGKLASSTGLTLARLASRLSGAREKIGRFLCPSGFLLDKHAAYGFDPGKLLKLPNFSADPPERAPLSGGGLCLSRFSVEKGTRVLLKALALAPGVPLTMAGQGPLEAELRQKAREFPGLTVRPWLDAAGVRAALMASSFVVMPSICYDNQPLALLEALALGLPLIASRIGGLPELVQDGVNGFLVEPGNAAELSEALRRMTFLDPQELRRMGEASRRIYEESHTPQRHLEGLMKAYAAAGA